MKISIQQNLSPSAMSDLRLNNNNNIRSSEQDLILAKVQGLSKTEVISNSAANNNDNNHKESRRQVGGAPEQPQQISPGSHRLANFEHPKKVQSHHLSYQQLAGGQQLHPALSHQHLQLTANLRPQHPGATMHQPNGANNSTNHQHHHHSASQLAFGPSAGKTLVGGSQANQKSASSSLIAAAAAARQQQQVAADRSDSASLPSSSSASTSESMFKRRRLG